MKKIFTLYLALLAFVVCLGLCNGITANAGSYDAGAIKMTADGGLAVKLLNLETQGANATTNATDTIQKGDVVAVNATSPYGVQLAVNASRVIGVAEEASAPNESAWYVVAGVAEVALVEGMGADYGDGVYVWDLGSDYTDQGVCNATEAQNATSFATVVEAVTGSSGVNATAKCLLKNLDAPVSGM